MNDFLTLWNDGHIPIFDGLYFPDGTIFDLRLRCCPSPRIIRGQPFVVDWRNVDSSRLTSLTETFCLDLLEFGKMSLGEGSYGSEGFFAYYNGKNELQWACYSEFSNPFITAEYKGDGQAIVESSADYRINVDVLRPQDMHIL
ncbi:MAG: hypothetical protein LBJ64_12765 [Deltaproteobacteria bacterium]|nr:hypothetical protein [Deltaproteobacteria bacterium]